MNVCETERVILRPFSETDGAFIIELLNDESFIRNIADKKIRSLNDAVSYLRNGPMISYQQYGFGLYLVVLKTTNTPIGMCGIVKREELAYPDLGYAFLPRYWGKGYAFESAKAVLEYAKHSLRLNLLLAVTLPNNEKSNRLLIKLGFSRIGEVELYQLPNNLYENKMDEL
ncbi:GNAT family N-acetyltransferase [Marinibactrum halimedae]|uniref:GNAT family N-acetyltransferase n=1 Tax=Marinibactrum halimedae TaxID=1444977 RepID=UPI001E64E3BD|nr:GNAT family N-acetyltransferase [Marinibactrum halimedae]MCD9460664.1 GNAT family N-acetyltransferase [Marinibactrum halimedae]